jgi:hypothetical protein
VAATAAATTPLVAGNGWGDWFKAFFPGDERSATRIGLGLIPGAIVAAPFVVTFYSLAFVVESLRSFIYFTNVSFKHAFDIKETAVVNNPTNANNTPATAPSVAATAAATTPLVAGNGWGDWFKAFFPGDERSATRIGIGLIPGAIIAAPFVATFYGLAIVYETFRSFGYFASISFKHAFDIKEIATANNSTNANNTPATTPSVATAPTTTPLVAGNSWGDWFKAFFPGDERSATRIAIGLLPGAAVTVPFSIVFYALGFVVETAKTFLSALDQLDDYFMEVEGKPLPPKSEAQKQRDYTVRYWIGSLGFIGVVTLGIFPLIRSLFETDSRAQKAVSDLGVGFVAVALSACTYAWKVIIKPVGRVIQHGSYALSGNDKYNSVKFWGNLASVATFWAGGIGKTFYKRVIAGDTGRFADRPKEAADQLIQRFKNLFASFDSFGKLPEVIDETGNDSVVRKAIPKPVLQIKSTSFAEPALGTKMARTAVKTISVNTATTQEKVLKILLEDYRAWRTLNPSENAGAFFFLQCYEQKIAMIKTSFKGRKDTAQKEHEIDATAAYVQHYYKNYLVEQGNAGELPDDQMLELKEYQTRYQPAKVVV